MSEWKLVGRLHKRNDFAIGRGSPFEALHRAIRKLTEADSISDVGITRKTNKYLEKQVQKAVKRDYPYLRSRKLRIAIAMEMLQYSPAEVSGKDMEDFHLYVRVR